ncbi:MAG: hypothetical protein ACK5OB_16770 [Pirellula sp.]
MLLAITFSFAGIGSNSSSAQGQITKPDESTEPPLKYTLKVGDQSIDINEGETARLEGVFTNPEVTLTTQPFREFTYQGISFRYPSKFVFEADLDDANYKNWTLSGNDFKIMYFVLNARLTTSDFAKSMMGKFGLENCELANAPQMKFGDKSLSGTTLNVTLAGNKLVIDIYGVSSNGKQTKLLVLQDDLDDSGNRSTEGKQALEFFRQLPNFER